MSRAAPRASTGSDRCFDVRDWPPITEPELLERMAFDDEQFVEFIMSFAGALGPREFTRELFEHGLAYPWARPQSSYVLRDGEVELLDDLDSATRAATVARSSRSGTRSSPSGRTARPSA